MDSINGFKELVKRISDPSLRDFLLKSEQQSVALWKEINDEIIKQEGEIKTQGTIKGAINHVWMKLKTDIVHSDIPTVLKNIQFCEEFNIERYKSTLSDNLPVHIKEILEKQLVILISRADRLEKLQKEFENKKIKS